MQSIIIIIRFSNIAMSNSRTQFQRIEKSFYTQNESESTHHTYKALERNVHFIQRESAEIWATGA